MVQRHDMTSNKGKWKLFVIFCIHTKINAWSYYTIKFYFTKQFEKEKQLFLL